MIIHFLVKITKAKGKTARVRYGSAVTSEES